MYNIQAAEILNKTMKGASDGNVSRFLHNLRAGQTAPPMTIEASAKVITLTATVAARRPSVVGHAGNPLHSLGCEMIANTIGCHIVSHRFQSTCHTIS
jgi:hypothetical protein